MCIEHSVLLFTANAVQERYICSDNGILTSIAGIPNIGSKLFIFDDYTIQSKTFVDWRFGLDLHINIYIYIYTGSNNTELCLKAIVYLKH